MSGPAAARPGTSALRAARKGRPRLLLVGGGHAHLGVLCGWVGKTPAADLTVVSTPPLQHYSAMVPGFLRGVREEAELAVDLRALAAKAGGRFLEGRAVRLAAADRALHLADGNVLPYDIVSLAVGCEPYGSRLRGVRENAVALKPISRAVVLRRRLQELVQTPGKAGARVVVVGGGAAGVEVACSAAALLDTARQNRKIVVLEAGKRLMGGYAPAASAAAARILAGKRVDVRYGAAVQAVEKDAVLLAGGEKLPADLTVWVTGPDGPELFRESGLPLDKRGFLLVDDSLRSVSDKQVFAAGDCATLASFPQTPKSGVFAVREGAVLGKVLEAALQGASLPRYQPQSKSLTILDTADGSALFCRGDLALHGRWAALLKHWIDGRFMARLHSLTT